MKERRKWQNLLMRSRPGGKGLVTPNISNTGIYQYIAINAILYTDNLWKKHYWCDSLKLRNRHLKVDHCFDLGDIFSRDIYLNCFSSPRNSNINEISLFIWKTNVNNDKLKFWRYSDQKAKNYQYQTPRALTLTR